MPAIFLLLLLVSSGGLWKRADSAKISCKTCKDFVASFHKVNRLWRLSKFSIGVIMTGMLEFSFFEFF